MKKLQLVLIALLLSLSANVSAQTADEIIDSYLETLGGKEKLMAIDNIKMVGNIAVQGMQIPVESTMTKDGKMFVIVEMGGTKSKQMICDGEKVWSMNRMTQKMEEMPGDQSKAMINEFKDFPNAFVNYKDNGYTAELIDTVTEDGVECYKIKLTKKPMTLEGEEIPNVSFHYFDTESFIPILVETEVPSGPAKGQMMKVPFSDYQEVDGIYFPYSTQMQGMPITYSEIVLNQKIEDSEFSVAEEEETPKTDEGNKN